MMIQPLTPERTADFAALFLPYFLEITQNDPEPLPTPVITDRLLPFVLGQWEKEIIRIDLCLAEDAPAGFVLYQIDAPESDWCKRPGWGFIREFYIVPQQRRKGCGRALVAHAVDALREAGAKRLYLTSDSAAAFWMRCGFTDEGAAADGTHTLSMRL